MKKHITTVIMIIFSCFLAFPACVFANEAIPKTNVGNITIVPPGESVLEGFIQYRDAGRVPLLENSVGLFINGSIISDADIVIENDRALLPLRLAAEYFGADVDWEPAARMVKITDGNNVVELLIDNNCAKINDNEYQLDAAPRIINGLTYVPARFVSEALNAKVDYFDGVDTTKPHIIIRMRHVMISRYPENAKIFTKEEAIERTREQLLIAFEKRHGEYIPPAPGEALTYATGGDKDMLRGVISNLSIDSENDRYYVIPVVYDFWFDNYTGDIYTFYNGQGMSINDFDPHSEGALAFPG